MKKITTLLLAVILSFSLVGCNIFGPTETTTTTMPITVDYDNIIDISTPQELQDMEIDKCYRLINDIDLTGFDFLPLGDFNQPFLGNLDGNGFTISNLTIDEANTIYAGLFGKLAGDVLNLTITDAVINYETDFLTYAGVVAGYTEGTVENVTINNATINITNTESNTYAGLLAGYTQPKLDDYPTADLFVGNEIINNTVTGAITVDSEDISFIGGLIGKVFNSHVRKNYLEAELNVTLNEKMGYIGGLIGHNFGGILVGFEEQLDDTNLYIEENIAISDINVITNSNNLTIGGLTGYDHYSYTRNNYSSAEISISGTVTEETEINFGSFLGENWSSKVSNNVSLYLLNNSLTGEYLFKNETFLEGLDLSEELFENNYILNQSNLVDVSNINGLTYMNTSQSTDTDFYLTNLSWTQTFIDLFLN